MIGKRELLAEFMFKTRLTDVLSHFAGLNKLVILNYHRIRPYGEAEATPFDDGVYTVDAHGFARQMRWLKKHARILSEGELVELIYTEQSKGQTARCPTVAITFDDGYYDNYATAYPILRAMEIPAFFFICTEMIWERKLRWWDVLAYLIKNCPKPFIVIDGQTYVLRNDRRKLIADLQLQMKEMPCVPISERIRSIAEAAEVSLPASDIQDRELMTRGQICEMAENRMTIGSHAHTHQALSCLDVIEHESELTVSKQLLEQTIGQPVKSVSYPFGRFQYIPPSIQDAARRCGYSLGFTSSFGINYMDDISEMALNRFSGDLDRISTLSLIAVWPELFASNDGSLNMLGKSEL